MKNLVDKLQKTLYNRHVNNKQKKDNMAKENRYTVLDTELKALSKEKKAKKAVMLQAQKDALEAYRKWVKETYKPAKKAALDKFKASKVQKTKTPEEKAAATKAKKAVKNPKAAKPTVNAKKAIEKGEAAIKKFKKMAAKTKVKAPEFDEDGTSVTVETAENPA